MFKVMALSHSAPGAVPVQTLSIVHDRPRTSFPSCDCVLQELSNFYCHPGRAGGGTHAGPGWPKAPLSGREEGNGGGFPCD